MTERVVLYGRGRHEDELCGGSVAWTDRYIDSLAPYMELPDGIIGQYFWYSDELFHQDGFCGGYSACMLTPNWSDGFPVIFARGFPIEHDIVHAIMRNTGRSSVLLLEEGLAEFLGGAISAGGNAGPMKHLLDLSFNPDSSNADYTSGDYARARHFVSFLVESYGLSVVLELCAAVPDGSSLEEFDQAALELLGRDLEQLLAEYVEYPSCRATVNRAKILECGREPIVDVGEGQEASFTIDASCASSGAVGPRSGMYYISEQIRVLDEGAYLVELEHPDLPSDPAVIPGYSLAIEQCAPCSEASSTYFEFADGSTSGFGHTLNSGEYTLTFGFPVDEISGASTTEVTVRVVGP